MKHCGGYKSLLRASFFLILFFLCQEIPAFAIDIHQLTNSIDNRTPCLNEGWVTWSGYDGEDYEIYLANLNTDIIVIHQISDNGVDDKEPSINSGGDAVVWSGQDLVNGTDYEIFYYYILSGISQLTDNLVDDYSPSMGENGHVVWERGIHGEIFYWHSMLLQEYNISNSVAPAPEWGCGYADTDSYDTVWQCYEYGQGGDTGLHVFYQTGGPLSAPDELPISGTFFSIYNEEIAYVAGGGGDLKVMFWDGTTSYDVSDDTYSARKPSLYNGMVAYELWDGHDWEIIFWNGSETIQVTDNEYDDTAPSLYGDTVAWSARPEGGASGWQIFYATGLISAGVTVSEINRSTTEAGGTAEFTVVLDQRPSESVTIPVSSSDTGEGSVDPAQLVFSVDNWDTPQTVSVSGVNDDVDDGDQNFTVILGPAVSTDTSFQGVDPADVVVTNIDDDTAGIIAGAVSGDTDESGATAQFTVCLGSEPLNTVTIQVESLDTSEGSVSPAALTFTPGNWKTNQTVIVQGVDDNTLDGDTDYTVELRVSASDDATYLALAATTVTLTNLDNDTVTPVIPEEEEDDDGGGGGCFISALSY